MLARRRVGADRADLVAIDEDVASADALKAVRGDGVIVKPDVPVTPVDSAIISDAVGVKSAVISGLRARRYRLLYVSPERALSPAMQSASPSRPGRATSW